jgi:hypothetical protein
MVTAVMRLFYSSRRQAEGWNRPDLRPVATHCLRQFVHTMKDWCVCSTFAVAAVTHGIKCSSIAIELLHVEVLFDNAVLVHLLNSAASLIANRACPGMSARSTTQLGRGTLKLHHWRYIKLRIRTNFGTS